jgi:hypothetical protein
MNKIRKVGDKVFFIEDNKIREGTIEATNLCLAFKKISDSTQKEEIYTTDYNSKEVFDSKEELIESLSK